ncbi:MAG: hypothetical protein LUD51_07050 [Clostridia bacterium]|nr:hypothetical protein [Clostridia bacterium]
MTQEETLAKCIARHKDYPQKERLEMELDSMEHGVRFSMWGGVISAGLDSKHRAKYKAWLKKELVKGDTE